MISVRSVTKKPLIHPSVSPTVLFHLAYRPTFFAGRDPWTAEEDEQLWSAFGKHGNRWHAIANTLQGRPGQFRFAAGGGTISILMDQTAIHCRNRLQSLQRVRAAADDAASPSPSESSSGMESLPSPSLPGSPIRSPPSSSGPVYDRESDSRFGLEVPPETPQDESFRIPTQALQQGFPITAPIPTDDPVGCWRETIPPNEFSVGGNVQFYQPPQVLATHLNPPTFNNSSPNPPVPFTMTCPVPHCCYQCQAVAEIWRHMTWTHIRPQPEDGIEGIVEKVVLGNV